MWAIDPGVPQPRALLLEDSTQAKMAAECMCGTRTRWRECVCGGSEGEGSCGTWQKEGGGHVAPVGAKTKGAFVSHVANELLKRTWREYYS